MKTSFENQDGQTVTDMSLRSSRILGTFVLGFAAIGVYVATKNAAKESVQIINKFSK